MMEESQMVEVEVVEIDGVAPQSKFQPSTEMSLGRDRRGWLRLTDRRWWPLWLILGLVVGLILLTAGAVLAVIYGCWRLLGKMVRWISR